MSRKLFVLIIFMVLFPVLIHAQEETLTGDATVTEEKTDNPLPEKPDFWVGLGGDIALYSETELGYGVAINFGYGSGSMIGFKAAFFFFEEDMNALELDLLLRFYIFGKNAYQGPFIQLIAGAYLVNYLDEFAIPSSAGSVNAGLSFGWRFILSNRFFVEPALRAGYPYFFGAGVSAGIRF
jgi:hypothetical protein